MKAIEIMNELFEMAEKRDYSDSCDTRRHGDPNVEVSKVGVAMVATPEVIRAVKEWGLSF